MSRSISVILNLKDQFTGPLKKATKDAKTTERSFKMSMNKIKKSGSNMESVLKNTKGMTAGQIDD